MEIACINCYEGECYDNNNPVYDGSGDGAVTKIPSHVDLISKQLYNTSHVWYSSGTNNGSATQQCPWLCSSLYNYLQNTVFTLLPQDFQDVIIEKCMLIERRYSSSSSSLTSPTGECWQPIGKLWVPNEVEIYGSVSSSSSNYGNYGIQYDTLNTSTKRIRYTPTLSSASMWWSLSIYSGYNSSSIVAVTNSGGSANTGGTTSIYFPLCARLQLN